MRDRWKRKGREQEAEEKELGRKKQKKKADGRFGSVECLVFQACWIKDI